MYNKETVETVLCIDVLVINPRLKSWVNDKRAITGNRFNGFNDCFLQKAASLRIK